MAGFSLNPVDVLTRRPDSARTMSREPKLPRRLLVAIGGNATHPDDIEGTSREHKAIAARTVRLLLPITRLENTGPAGLTCGGSPLALAVCESARGSPMLSQRSTRSAPSHHIIGGSRAVRAKQREPGQRLRRPHGLRIQNNRRTGGIAHV